MRKLALKNLTASDLTIFDHHFQKNAVGNQKSINLNRNIFVDQLFPALIGGHPRTYSVALSLSGPGLQPTFEYQRKIVRSASSKNWRLNGEVINDRPGQTNFGQLQVGDFVLLDFGDDVTPKSLRAVFIAQNVNEDRPLHTMLSGLIGTNSMVRLNSQQLAAHVLQIAPPPAHPIHSLVLDDALEDAVMGGVQGQSRIARRPGGRNVTREEAGIIREKIGDIGFRGEGFVKAYLQNLKLEERIVDFRWVSAEAAFSPYDFSVTDLSNSTVLVDAKSTEGDFSRTIHVSYSELLQMAQGPESYDLYRIYDMQESSAKLRISRDVRERAAAIIGVMAALPAGITPDGVSIQPELLEFEAEITVDLPQDEEA